MQVSYIYKTIILMQGPGDISTRTLEAVISLQ